MYAGVFHVVVDDGSVQLFPSSRDCRLGRDHRRTVHLLVARPDWLSMRFGIVHATFSSPSTSPLSLYNFFPGMRQTLAVSPAPATQTT